MKIRKFKPASLKSLKTLVCLDGAGVSSEVCQCKHIHESFLCLPPLVQGWVSRWGEIILTNGF